ncbi:MAG: HAMP domain-containing sensor histidine kinase [Solirubrobacterales bacterium]
MTDTIDSTSEAGRRSLFWGLFVPNALVLVTATTVLSLSPARLPFPDSLDNLLVLLGGLALLLIVNLLLMRRAWQPLERLTRLMQSVDPLKPGKRIPVYGGGSEVVELAASFNRMLDRIESERLDYGRRTLAAQEDERRRVARELHDEIGQTLTALMLQLGSTVRHAPVDIKEGLADATETARATVESLHRILRELRPEALDDLGLPSALATLADRVEERTGLLVSVELDDHLPPLAPEEELVVYRVAQESLTNVIKHARASRAKLSLLAEAGGVSLAVRDDGQGMNGAPAGNGIRGMRERALLVGASLEIEPAVPNGLEVRLAIPIEPR